MSRRDSHDPMAAVEAADALAADTTAIRDRLAVYREERREVEARRAEIMERVRPMIVDAYRAGVGPDELCRWAGLARKTVYAILDGADNPPPRKRQPRRQG